MWELSFAVLSLYMFAWFRKRSVRHASSQTAIYLIDVGTQTREFTIDEDEMSLTLSSSGITDIFDLEIDPSFFD